MVAIDGQRLRQDREDRQFSRESFIQHIFEKTGISLSVMTLRRAENGNASGQTMRAITSAIGFPAERYNSLKQSTEPWRTNFDLNGEWLVYYLEDDVNAPAYIAVERLFVKHTGSTIRGIYEPLQTEHPSGYLGESSFVMEGQVIENSAFGKYYVSGRSYPRGSGVFQHILLRNGTWAEGVCTFFADDGTIMVSANFWLKKASPEFQIMREQVESLLQEYKPHLKFPISTG